MTIVGNVLTQFPQTNTIIKSSVAELLMSGELDFDEAVSSAVSIACYIGKKKGSQDQQLEGNLVTLETYVMAEINVNPTLESHDILITEDGRQFIVGEVTPVNENTAIGTGVDDASYLRADLELYKREGD